MIVEDLLSCCQKPSSKNPSNRIFVESNSWAPPSPVLASNSRPAPPRRNRLAHSHGHLTMSYRPFGGLSSLIQRETGQSKSYANQPDNHWNEKPTTLKKTTKSEQKILKFIGIYLNLPYLFNSNFFFIVKTTEVAPTKVPPFCRLVRTSSPPNSPTWRRHHRCTQQHLQLFRRQQSASLPQV